MTTEQSVIAQFSAWAEAGIGVSEMASRLNVAGIKPRQGTALDKAHHLQPATTAEPNSEPRGQRPIAHRRRCEGSHAGATRPRGHTHAQVASILNELGFLPMKGRRFTQRSVRKLFGRCRQTKVLSPRRFLEAMLERMRREHEAVSLMRPLSDRDSRRWRRCSAMPAT